MSVLDTLAVDSHARLVSKVGDPREAGFKIVRSWNNVHADYADTIVLGKKRDRKVINPVSDRQTDSGQFIISSVTAVENGDAPGSMRTVTIREELTKFKPVTDTGINTVASEPLTQKEIYNLFGINTGTGDVEGRRYRHLDNTDTAAKNARDAATVPVITAGYTEAQRGFSVGEDNTGTLNVVFRKVTWSNNNPTFRTFAIDNEGGYGERTTQRATGMAIDSAVNWMVDTARRKASIDTHVSFGLTERRNGEGVVTQRVHGGVEKDTESAYYPITAGTRGRRERTKYMVHPNDVDTAYGAMKGWVSGQDTNFIHVGVRKELRPDGFANITTIAAKDPNVGAAQDWWPQNSDTVVEWETHPVYKWFGSKLYVKKYVHKTMWKFTKSQSAAKTFILVDTATSDARHYYLDVRANPIDNSSYRWKPTKTRVDTHWGGPWQNIADL